jgi:hypothetical protein
MPHTIPVCYVGLNVRIYDSLGVTNLPAFSDPRTEHGRDWVPFWSTLKIYLFWLIIHWNGC